MTITPVDAQIIGANPQAIADALARYVLEAGSSSGSAFVLRPSGGGDGTTWADAMAAVASAAGPIRIEPDFEGVPLTITDPGVYDMRNGVFGYGRPYSHETENVLVIGDGVTLKNLSSCDGGCQVEGANTLGPALAFDAPTPGHPIFFDIANGAVVTGTSPVPMLTVSPPDFLIVDLRFYGQVGTGTPLVHLTAGAACVALHVFSGLVTGLGDGWITGDPGSMLIYAHDGTIRSPLPVIPGYLGAAVLNAPVGVAGGRGSTLFRPVPLFTPTLAPGVVYYDTDLGVAGRLIVWDGLIWRYADGAVV